MQTILSDVVIIGCGPTGVMLANLLGQFGHRVAVLERAAEVYPVPRATHVDEETMRNFQTTGLMPTLLEHCTRFGKMDVVSQTGKIVFEAEIADPASVHGFPGSYFFHQPNFERILRQGLQRYPNVTLHTGVAAEQVASQADGATVFAKVVATNEPLEFHAAWVIGCDGGQSLTRATLHLQMESLAPKRQWVIVDTLLKRAEDSALLPSNFRYVLDPRRLTIFAHGIGLNRRWEFQLEEGEAVPTDEEALRWVAEFIDLAKVEVLRIANYAHNALIADRWQQGRVLVAGDAAHMMPPSAGQGLCSGIRDAINLAWKLDGVLCGRADARLLATYEEERKFHLREVLEGTLVIGRLLEAENAVQRWLREVRLQTLNALPPVRKFFRQRSLRRPALRSGFLCREAALAGHHFPQVKVTVNGQAQELDDVLGYRFALVTSAGNATATLRAWAQAHDIGVWELGQELVEVDGALSRWMQEKKIEFALVRPDHLIFGAGTMLQLAAVQTAFDSWQR